MNTNKILSSLFLLMAVLLQTITGQPLKQPIDYADVFIGTSNSRWMLGPYACVPFGMVQLGPDNQGREWMGGYEYAINSVAGFSHLHAWTMAGLRIMPTTADLVTADRPVDAPYLGANAGYHSRIQKETEKATPGFYSVYLYDHKVNAEMTATTHCGFQRYTFPKSKESRILVDLYFPGEADYSFKLNDAKITRINGNELEGYAKCRGGLWALWNDYTLYFVIKFSKAPDKLYAWKNKKTAFETNQIEGKKDIGVFATWKTDAGDQILVKSGISLVSIDQARLNLDTELGNLDWNFDMAKNNAQNTWSELLSRIDVEGGTETDRTKFYSNMYRAFSQKQTWNDVNGKYRDAKEQIQTISGKGQMYGGDAFWNSFWNLNGLWSIMSPEIIENWVYTQLEMFKHTGQTGKGPTGIEYSGIMEGSHEMALMTAAWQKGIVNGDSLGEAIYKAMYNNVSKNGKGTFIFGGYGNPGLKTYARKGYIPYAKAPTSRTLDYAYDDWTVAQMAKSIGKTKDYEMLMKRSQNYRNVFDTVRNYVVPRKSSGKWIADFDKFSNKSFIEGNSWQYSWYVPHDVPGLINLMGKDTFNARLESGFEKSAAHNFAAHFFDRTTGESAEYYINHGNEVNMQSAWLFNYSGKPWLCQKYTRAIMNAYYGSTPYHGWEGDEDEGQMGAWFVMSAMGLFEMDGGCSENPMIEIGSPLFSKITIHLSHKYYNGGTFVIECLDNSTQNIYVQSAMLNGIPLKTPRFPFSELVKGGKLVLQMGSEPNKLWGN